MAVPSAFSLLISLIFLTTLLFSRASSYANAHTNLHRLQLLASVGRSTSTGANGGVVTVELWCVAKNNAENSALQTALDWCCGPGGADCGPIQQGGLCYDPNDVQRMASFAFNSYFLKHGLTEDSCNFDGSAALTSLNPSHGSCKFPSSFTVKNGSFTGSSTTLGVGSASADISRGSYFAGTHYWPLITTHLFYAITLSF